jgi:porphobilinogen synthase
MNTGPRPQRLRQNQAIRTLVRETWLNPESLVMPYFVVEGTGVRRPIASLPGQYHFSPDRLAEEVSAASTDGIRMVLLFGIPDRKDDTGSGASASDGVVQKAVRAVKERVPDMLVVTDVCLCAYTAHGHCGVLRRNGDGGADIDHAATLERLAETALSHARAGADIVAPSAMADGQVRAIRDALDEYGFCRLPILAYSVKYASAFYGPFREAAGSAPGFGDRTGYQMDPANGREALREAALDRDEGADMLMVKPALGYLDIVRQLADRYVLPVAAYNVSGEYAMLKAAAAAGWIDEKKAVMETLTCIRRAGASIIISYHARDAACWLNEAGRGAHDHIVERYAKV